ncbi:DUF6961 family protein [Sphingopyxis terrae]
MMPTGNAGSMTPEHHIWACALAIERQQGSNAAIFVAERVGALALQGDAAGVEMWKAIAARLQDLSRQGGREQG